MTDSDHTPSPTHCISCGTEVPDHAEFCQRSRSSTSRCFQGYCLAISPARQPNTEFSAAGAAW